MSEVSPTAVPSWAPTGTGGLGRLHWRGRSAAEPAAPPPGAAEPRWLREVRLRASRRVLFVRHRWARSGYAEEHLLAISHSEVDRALEAPEQIYAQELAFYREDPQASALSQAIAALAERPEDARWAHLVEVLALSPQERALLALAVGAAADPLLARVFGYLQDGTSASAATPALAGDLFPGLARIPPGPDSALLSWRLVRQAAGDPTATSAASGFEADAQIVRALTAAAADVLATAGAADWSVGCAGTRLAPPPDGGLRAGVVAEVADFVRTLSEGNAGRPQIEVEVVGPSGSGRRTFVAAVAAALGLGLVVLDGAGLVGEADPTSALIRELRRVVLEGGAVALSQAERLSPEMLAAAAAALARCPLRFSCVEQPAAGPTTEGAIRRSVSLAALGREQRLQLWSLLAPGPAPAAVADWELRPGEIVAAARVAPAGDAAVVDTCRRLLTASSGELVSALPLPYGWEDLVLAPTTAAHLRELEAQTRDRSEVLDDWGLSRLTPMGRGTTALFAGPSGTGKTMATQVLARALGLDCIRVDLAGVVSKYIGETEKQLREVFLSCERAPALLFFDEADALFGKRTQVSDAHDRYANIEIDYLLQQMERFNGLAVLATNRKGDLDTAFVRRLRFIVDFTPPTVAERERLWHLCLDGARDRSGRPLVGELDYPGLAKELDLTGAAIKSAALAAAYLARSEGSTIELRHVIAAGRRELEKQGLVVRPGQLERT